MERKLASIQKIIKLVPHWNADTLDIATVLGWKCVVKKDSFKEGDLCVYFEIDSVLPPLPEFEFLQGTPGKYRLMTARLRGQISQGLCWPLNILPEGHEAEIGTDVTKLLGVKKYEEEIPESMIGVSKGRHPTVVPKPGEMRAQSCPRLIDEFMGKLVAVTTKVEGVASSFINDNGEIHVCSHNASLIESQSDLYWQIAYKYNIIDTLKKVGNISIQGEIAGSGIFGNRLSLDEKELFVFKIFDNDAQRYYGPVELCEFCNKHGLQHVPMDVNVKFDFTLEQLLELADGTYSPSGNTREGIVIVPMEPCYSESLCGNLSMKVINNNYMMKGRKSRNRDWISSLYKHKEDSELQTF